MFGEHPLSRNHETALAFVARLDLDGNFLWVEGPRGWGSSSGLSVAVGEVGNVFLAGRFDGAVRFGSQMLNNLQGGSAVLVCFHDRLARRSYQSWRQGKFPNDAGELEISPDSDPDGDGISNWVEFGLNGVPTLPDPGIARIQARMEREVDSQLLIEFTRPSAMSGIRYLFETSDDLENWKGLLATVHAFNLGNGQERVVLRDASAVGGNRMRYVRLRLGGDQ